MMRGWEKVVKNCHKMVVQISYINIFYDWFNSCTKSISNYFYHSTHVM